MSTPQEFKGDLFQSIFEHLKAIVKPALVIGLISYAISTASTYGLLAKLGIDMTELQEMSRNGSNDPEAMLDYFQGFGETALAAVQQYWPLIVVGYLVLFLFQIYISVFMLEASDKVALGGDSSIADVFSRVKIMTVLKLLLTHIMMLVFIAVVFGIAIVPVAIHRMLGLLLIFTIPAACIFLVRCAFYIPAMVIGEKGIMDSIRWSFNHITWIRALKIVGIGFVVAIILGMVGGIGGGIAGAMGTTGLALNHIISGLMQGVTLAGTAAFYTGLWYRFTYTETEQDTEIEEIGTE